MLFLNDGAPSEDTDSAPAEAVDLSLKALRNRVGTILLAAEDAVDHLDRGDPEHAVYDLLQQHLVGLLRDLREDLRGPLTVEERDALFRDGAPMTDETRARADGSMLADWKGAGGPTEDALLERFLAASDVPGDLATRTKAGLKAVAESACAAERAYCVKGGATLLENYKAERDAARAEAREHRRAKNQALQELAAARRDAEKMHEAMRARVEATERELQRLRELESRRLRAALEDNAVASKGGES
jgi:hypothetical protein